MHYKTIESITLDDFNKKCNELFNDGYVPWGNIVMVVFGQDANVFRYVQQWTKII